MPRDMASLLSMPMTPSPPDADASASGRDQVGNIQGLMGGQGGAQGGPGMGPPAPDYATTVAALRHLGEFQRHWRSVMATPGFGQKDIKGAIIDMMADVMGEGLISLSQVMSLLKSLPTDPLKQRQFVEQHLQNDEKAAVMILQHHAAAFPQINPGDIQAAQGKPANHLAMMKGLADHYKARTPKGRR